MEMEILSSITTLAPWSVVALAIVLLPLILRAKTRSGVAETAASTPPGYAAAFSDLENREFALSQWATRWFENQGVPTDGPLVAVLPAPLDRGIPLAMIDVIVEPTAQNLKTDGEYRDACAAAGQLPKMTTDRVALAFRAFKSGREPGAQRFSLQLTTKPFNQLSYDHMVNAIDFARTGSHSIDYWKPTALGDNSPLMGFSCLTIVKRADGAPIFFSIDRSRSSKQAGPEVLGLAPAGMLHPEPGMRAGSNVLARMLVSEMADAFPGESISNLLRCVGEQRVRPYLLGLGLNPLTRVVEVMFAMIIEPSVLPQSFVAALTDGRERQVGAIRTHTLDRLPSMLQGQPWSCGANATLSWAVAHRDWLDSQIEDLTPHTVNHISYTASDGELFSPEEISFFGISPRLSARIDRFQGVFLRSSQDAILQEVARCDLPFGASLLSVIQTPLDPNESDVECNIVSIAVRNDEIVRDPNDCVVMVWNRVARNEESGTDFGGLAGGFRREQQSILRAWMEDIEASANGATPGYRLNRTWPAIEPRGQAVEYQPKNPAFVGRNWANPATIDIRPSSRV